MFQSTCGGQRTTHDSLFILYMGLGIELSSSGLTASIFTGGTFSLALSPVFHDKVVC